MQPEISYLQTNYNAFQMGVEKDHHGLSVLMIKAVNMCKRNNFKDFDKILQNEEKMLDWMMSMYNNNKEKHNLISSFVEKISQ